MKILIVDDSKMSRMRSKKMLEGLGYNDFIEVENGSLALRIIDEVDLVLLDWEMPVMTGMSVLKELKSRRVPCKAKIIFVTAKSTDTDVARVLKEGADDYIVKPYSMQTLQDKVQRMEKQIEEELTKR
jgi:two-component system, chemotaxis family, chemotaxis protein CheY